MIGVWSGKVRSTPTLKLTLRTVKVSRTPPPWRRMTTPLNCWMRERLPSTTFTWTLTVSPGRNVGMSTRIDTSSTLDSFSMVISPRGCHMSSTASSRKGWLLEAPSGGSPCGRGASGKQATALMERQRLLKQYRPSLSHVLAGTKSVRGLPPAQSGQQRAVLLVGRPRVQGGDQVGPHLGGAAQRLVATPARDGGVIAGQQGRRDLAALPGRGLGVDGAF